MDLQSDALEFIVAYYSTMTYHQTDLPKFYDEMALILRPTFQEPKSVSEAQSYLAFLINKGSSINIISKSIIPSNDYLAISIIGSININGKENIFTQMFVLQEKYDRLYITSDSIQLVEAFKPENNFIVRKKNYTDFIHNSISSDNDSSYPKKDQSCSINKEKIPQEKITGKNCEHSKSINDDQENEC